MTEKFDAQILDAKGRPIEEGEPKEALTLRGIVEPALIDIYPDDNQLPAAGKVARWKLFQKVSGGCSFESLKAEEVSMIKNLIGRRYATLIVGRAFDIIDPPE